MNTKVTATGDGSSRFAASGLICEIPEKRSLHCQFSVRIALWAFAAFLVTTAGQVHAFPLPNIPNVFNVRNYGATGDGTTDDTAAIQAAVNAARSVKAPLVYLPNGTYRVSNTIQLCETGADNEWMTFQGESMTGTVIQLADGAPGFGDPAIPKAVVLATPGSGATFQHQSVIDLTINTGSNNPGVIALDQHSNNVGVSENLLLTSADSNGYLGFSFKRPFGGTHFVKKVEVVGFSTGIDLIANAKSNVLLEHIVVRNADVGVYCRNRCVGIRDLQTFDVKQPVHNVNLTNLAIIDSTFRNGTSGFCGINFNHVSGHLFVRNVTSEGFDAVVSDNGTPTGGAHIDEWHTGSKVKLWDHAPDTTLNLPILETPDLAWDLSNAVIVDCQAQNYDSDAIQNAIDNSGKEIVILSGVDPSRNNTGIVKLDKSVYVRGGVKRIYGSKMETEYDDPNDPRYAFIIETGSQPVVSIDTFRTVMGGILNQSSKTVVLRELRLWHVNTCYETASATPGDLFWEHVNPVGNNLDLQSGPQVIFRNQNVWSRGLNMTGVNDQLHAYNSDVWLFGINSGEKHPETWLASHPGARLEVMSGFMDTGGGGSVDDPPSGGMIKSYGGDISVASCGVFKKDTTRLSTLLWEQKDWEGSGAEIRTKSITELPISQDYYHMPFYRAAVGHVCKHGELLVNGDMSAASYAMGGSDAQFQDLDQGWVVALPDNLDLTTNPGKLTWDGTPNNRLADSLAQIRSVPDITGNTLVVSFDWTPPVGSLHPTLQYSLVGWKRTGTPVATSDFFNNIDGGGHSASGLDGQADAIDLLAGINKGSGDSNMSFGSATGTAGSSTHHVVSIDMSKWAAGLNKVSDYDYIGIRFHIPGDHTDLTAIGSMLDNVSVSVFSRSCGWCDFVNDYGLTGSITTDSDSDGELDLYEFALGGNPTIGTSKGMVPSITRHPDGSVSYEHWQVKHADPGITYLPEWSENLETWFSTWDSTASSASSNPAYDEVEHRISGQGRPRLFFRLKIVK